MCGDFTVPFLFCHASFTSSIMRRLYFKEMFFMTMSIGLLLTFILLGGSIAALVGAVVAEMQYRRELKKLSEIAKKIEEIKIP